MTQFTKLNLISKMEIFLTYWGFHHNWDKHNGLVFNGKHVVELSEKVLTFRRTKQKTNKILQYISNNEH